MATKSLPNDLGWHRMLAKVNASPSGKAMVAVFRAPRWRIVANIRPARN